MDDTGAELFAAHQNLHEKLATFLEEQILTGELDRGETLLSEREMAEQYGLSRTVVRDAIRILMARGLVEVRHGVGAIVTADQRKSFAQALNLLLRRGNYSKIDVIEVRRILEIEIAALAAERLTPEIQQELQSILDRYHQTMLHPTSESLSTDAHKEFHATLLKATGNQVLIDLLDPFVVFSVPARSSTPQPTTEEVWADFNRHVSVFDAVCARDPERARAAMLEHIRWPEERVRREMENKEK
ncbi:MAG: FadR family transcriptional regulator [Chloroflexi bacterium]|nr:FadR family transcriptional regulator [Chloroflexota bacterium]